MRPDLGVFGFSFLIQNEDRIRGALVDDIPPTFEEIASGRYEISRSLFFYLKKAHLGMIPGLAEFLNTFTSEKAWGDEGYLIDKGLIPLPLETRRAATARVRALEVMKDRPK